LKNEFGESIIEVSRDRERSFEPISVSKHQSTSGIGFKVRQAGKIINKIIYLAVLGLQGQKTFSSID